MGNVWTSVRLTQTRTVLSVMPFVRLPYNILISLNFVVGFSQSSFCTHMLFGLFASRCPNKPLNPVLKLSSGFLPCVTTVNAGNPVKPIMIIIITEAPWRLEDAVHHNLPSIFPAGPFFSSPYRQVPVRWLWIRAAVVNSIL